MASKKTSASKKTKTAKKTATPKAEKKAVAKPVKMFTTAGRLFGAAKEHTLPKGTFVNIVGDISSFAGIKLRVGTEKAVTFEGDFLDTVQKALEAQGLKVRFGGPQIAAPGAPLASA